MRSPVRALAPSNRSLTGRLVLRAGPVATFESALERDWLTILDADPAVHSICVQPFRLDYEDQGRSRHYTPDISAIHDRPDGTSIEVVYEVKPHEELREHWAEYRARFVAANQYCRSQGARFSIVTERDIRTPLLKNAAFLRQFMTRPESAETTCHLLTILDTMGPTTPQALLAAAFLPRDQQLAAVPSLWRLIAYRRIAVDLDRPLSMACAIAPGDG